MALSERFPGSPPSARTVAIVGGGFAGAVLAAQLLRKSAGSMYVCLAERAERLGRGAAYGTRCPDHLLNVRAGGMSAFPDDPQHFLRWVLSHRNPEAQPDDFLPRCLYGDYVEALLLEESERFPGHLELVHDEAVSIDCHQDTATIHFRGGHTRTAGKAVLALGNFPPAPLHLPGIEYLSGRCIQDPWDWQALRHFVPTDDVLLVGCGLTGADVLVELRLLGLTGKIHMLSRHGLLPQSHQPTAAWPSFATLPQSGNLLELMRAVRMQVTVARMRGYDWRAVIDAMRPASQALWQSLSLCEKQRFLRHLRSWWQVHRHRIAPRIGAKLHAELAAGTMEIHAGRIAACREHADGVEVVYRDRHTGGLRPFRVQRIVNCTGPQTDCCEIASPLMSSLLQRGLIRPDPLHLGLDTDGNGALLHADGAPSVLLYTLGSARKGTLWETTAVPEIRTQASALADRFVAGVGQGSALHHPGSKSETGTSS